MYECNVSSTSTEFPSPGYYATQKYMHTFNHIWGDTDQMHVGICNMMISVCQCMMYRSNENMSILLCEDLKSPVRKSSKT